ncbi:MAG: hypothetical protein DCC57_16855 [Chloroflexi bacterium]|nr:MAG: hypothetical protein DCC57_16855 [Chloroflexota bacterium]
MSLCLWPRGLGLALLVALALAGCGPLAAEEVGSVSVAPEVAGTATPVAENQVVLVIPEEPATLNQYLAAAAIVRQVADATSAPLATVDADGQYAPVLAAELPTLENGGVSADLMTVTWKLRPGLRWSDGQPLTSDDVKFTWEAVSHPDSGAVPAVPFDLIERVETPDALTAVVHYRRLNPGYLQQFMLGILPRHATGAPEQMLNWAWNQQPVSAGPFVVQSWLPGESIVMARNPYYYLPGQPYVDRLVFQIVPDPGAQLALMASGAAEVQLLPGESKPVYDDLMGGVATLRQTPGQWNMALRFNLSRPDDDDPGPSPPHPILGDLRVRQALAHAINYGAIIFQVNPGTTPVTTPLAYGWYECAQPRVYRYSQARAKYLLEQAGWVEGEDGVRVASGALYVEDGTRLSLRLQGYNDFQPLVDLEDALVAQFAAVGVELVVENDPMEVVFGSYADGARRKLGNFDMLLYDTSLPIEPQAVISTTFHSMSIPSPENLGGGNYMRWVNPAADAAIERAGGTLDLAARRQAYCDLSGLIATDLPQIHLYVFPEGYGVSRRLRGFVVNRWGSMTWGAQAWKLDPLQ